MGASVVSVNIMTGTDHVFEEIGLPASSSYKTCGSPVHHALPSLDLYDYLGKKAISSRSFLCSADHAFTTNATRDELMPRK